MMGDGEAGKVQGRRGGRMEARDVALRTLIFRYAVAMGRSEFVLPPSSIQWGSDLLGIGLAFYDGFQQGVLVRERFKGPEGGPDRDRGAKLGTPMQRRENTLRAKSREGEDSQRPLQLATIG